MTQITSPPGPRPRQIEPTELEKATEGFKDSTRKKTKSGNMGKQVGLRLPQVSGNPDSLDRGY